MNEFLAVGLTNSTSSMCGICQVVVRLEGKNGIAPLRNEGVNPRAAVVEAQWLEDCKQGNVARLGEERLVSLGTLAFFARAEFLMAFESICGEPFPWAYLAPITLLSPNYSNGNSAIDSSLNALLKPYKGVSYSSQVVLGNLQQIRQLCLQAGKLILDHIRQGGCAYLDHPSLEDGWKHSLDWLEQAASLGVYLVGSRLPDLWLDFHLLIGAVYDVRRDTSGLEDYFKYFVKPLWSEESAGPPINWEKFQQKVADQRNSLERGHPRSCSHAKNKQLSMVAVDDPRFNTKAREKSDGEEMIVETSEGGTVLHFPTARAGLAAIRRAI